MNSALYAGTVVHQRVRPKRHRLTMAPLAGEAAIGIDQMAIDHQPAADAGAENRPEHDAVTAAGALKRRSRVSPGGTSSDAHASV